MSSNKSAYILHMFVKLGLSTLLGVTLAACADAEDMASSDPPEDERAEAQPAAPFTAISDDAPAYVSFTTQDWETTNRCAHDPVYDIDSAFNTSPNYVLAYRSGKSGCGEWAPTNHDGELVHRQGIQRLNRNGASYLLVSGSTEDGILPGFEVVEMGSRPGDDMALGSGGVTTTTWPNCEDHIVNYTSHSASSQLDHSGGLQVLGRYAVLALESTNDSTTAGFMIADLNDPEMPVPGSFVARQRGTKTDAGAVAMTRLSDGTYMVMVFGYGSNQVEVFVSTGTTMSLSSSFWASKWQESTPSGFASYQNVQLVARCDGRLYALGTHRNGSNQDWVDLWQVTLSTDGNYNPTFTKVANAHVYCSNSHTDGIRYCNFSAGGGAYVDGIGRMIVYGVEHYDDAYPNTGFGVKVREFVTNY